MTLSVITSKIEEAEISAGRAIGSTQLIAVSKVQSNERVLNVLEQGHKVFGENKVQEAHGKWPMFCENFSNPVWIRMRMIRLHTFRLLKKHLQRK